MRISGAMHTAPSDERWNSWGDRWKAVSLTSIYRSIP